MGKIYTALGLMSGTSGDGVDASIIKSDGNTNYEVILDKYYKYTDEIYKEFHNLKKAKDDRNNFEKFFSEYEKTISFLEDKITLFNADLVNEIIISSKINIDLIGFHGQTIWHDPEGGVTRQLGNGKLLSKSTKKNVIYDFRANDLKNKGQGAPLAPIFHKLLIDQNKLSLPVTILNIGGISNITITVKNNDYSKKNMEAFDIGPGNCLIDEWIRKNSDKNFDEDGLIGKSGKVDQLILNQAIDNFEFNSYDKSLDVKDFDISFAKGLSLEDGCATITDFTAYLISKGIKFCVKKNKEISKKYLTCGGGRLNHFLIEKIQKYLNSFEDITLFPIELYNLDGDFIESQAFGYLAIRSYLDLPISFPTTTRCKEPTRGGVIVKNY